jgi:hypothetical protein
MTSMTSADSLVLNEEQAIELLALLITSARTQLDEPTVYGPMRLLTAAERLIGFVEAKASPATQEFMHQFATEIAATQDQMAVLERYTAAVDDLCRSIAGHLLVSSGLEEGAT